MAEATPGALSVGQVFHGKYEIVRCLAAGGMGAIYECVHRPTRKHRALKIMLPRVVENPAMRARFELEARVTAEIESEHIVETFDAGVDEETGAPFLVMELLRGEDLGSTIARRGGLPPNETVALLTQAALALDKTHAAGIVHRDLKPDNLFVTTRDDGSPRLKILDFGIAKVVADASQPVKQTATIGTPLYMSPEQITGDGAIGPRADLFALGHIAYALLVGPAYREDELDQTPAIFAFLARVMAGPPEPPSARAARRGVALPPAFDAWFARATAQAPGDRFDRASTLVHELALALGADAPRSAPARAAVPASTGWSAASDLDRVASSTTIASDTAAPRRAGWKVPAIVLGLTLAGAAGAFAFFGSRAREPGPSAAAAAPPSMEMPPPATASAPPPAATGPTVTPAPPPEPAPSAPAAVTTQPRKNAAAAPAKAAASAAPVTPPRGCDPPYEIDAAGHRRIKPYCL